jgi:hypothetical protein
MHDTSFLLLANGDLDLIRTRHTQEATCRGIQTLVDLTQQAVFLHLSLRSMRRETP